MPIIAFEALEESFFAWASSCRNKRAMSEDDRSVIFKICPRSMWEDAKARGEFVGSEVDLKDGFIHFSSPTQYKRTLELYFAGQTDLVLLTVPVAPLQEHLAALPGTPGKLQWDLSKNRGEYFAHLYGVGLPVSAVAEVTSIPDAR